jgi:hypothetical protein
LNRPTDEETLETAVRVVGSWCEMAARLRWFKLGTEERPQLEDVTRKRLVKTVTENTSLYAIVMYIV